MNTHANTHMHANVYTHTNIKGSLKKKKKFKQIKTAFLYIFVYSGPVYKYSFWEAQAGGSPSGGGCKASTRPARITQ